MILGIGEYQELTHSFKKTDLLWLMIKVGEFARISNNTMC